MWITDCSGKETKGETLAHLVRDIDTNPGKYYLNFDSIASWTYWELYGDGSPVGMCRGEMQLSQSSGQFDLQEERS